MTTVVELISKAKTHGITFELANGSIKLRAPKQPPDDLLAELRRFRPIIREYLSGDLLARLRKGHKWMIEQYQLFNQDDTARASDAAFTESLSRWIVLELELRMIHGYQGCVYGEGERCPDTEGMPAPVVCDACVEG